MKLKIKRPIVFFDLETTGLSTSNDRIVEVAMTKINPDGTKENYYSLVNPGMPIPKEASDIHGIDAEKVSDAPMFKTIANDVFKFIETCDLGGFNIHKFDVPFIFEELLRNGIVLNTRTVSIIDPYVIIRKYEPRDLSSLYKRYTGKDLDNAHSAIADNDATIEIFEKQLELYGLPESVEEIHESVFEDKGRIDLAGKYILDKEKNSVVFNFGKYTGKTIREVFDEDRNYFDWIIDKSAMSTETKMFTKKFKDTLTSKQIHS